MLPKVKAFYLWRIKSAVKSLFSLLLFMTLQKSFIWSELYENDQKETKNTIVDTTNAIY